jgi:hypothetical protein
MSQLIRLVYASRSTFAPGAASQGLDPSVARILAKSRKNNAARGIVGGLLFGDGCFLQCLEGEEQVVDALYEKIRVDARHQDVTTLSRHPVEHTSFGTWSMKFAPGEVALRQLMKISGMVRFDPYAFSPEQLAVAVAHMERMDEAAPSVVAEQPDATERTGAAARKKPVSFIDTFTAEQPVAGHASRPSAGSVASAPASQESRAEPAGGGRAVYVILGVVVLAALLLWGVLSRTA